ncbi:DUF4249 domain-containing protein [Arenibacter sp. N53]|uniref:DUF4249 domain-containing protein n=1 Tax=Arenibacter TaxID=178469 RepID=UPI000CD465E2|nr:MULTISPECIES: DUF4249 domain-containing protein [Arenibacter]MCM4154029.1 DUF4249 domain-containing protein [Arenibacter sp. N53]
MKKIKNILIYFILLLLIGCTEPFPIQDIDFEDILIVESTITNEMKQQRVKLSRTISLESFGQNIEKNAIVQIEDSNGTTFTFSQDTETGDYVSDEEFQAVPNISYTLKIKTGDGRGYISKPVQIPAAVPIERVYAELISENGKEGISVFVDTDNTNGSGQYFRYEYEETYKVKLPNPKTFDWEVVNYNNFSGSYELELTQIEQDFVCYSSVGSKGIVQTSSGNLGENKVLRFPVRFIDKGDPVLRERYSIIVKQYIQSLEAYTFYSILENLGNAGSLLSPGQPGYVTGNVGSETNAEEKVLGFFEASSVSSQRIYFDYNYFGLELPPYFVECEAEIIGGPTEILKRKLEFEGFQIFFYEEIELKAFYHIARSECSECTSFSTNIKPDFWED